MSFGSRKATYFSLVILSFLTLSIFAPVKVAAAVDPACDNSNVFLGIPPWYKYLEVGNEEVRDDSGNIVYIDECAITGPKNAEGNFDLTRAIGPIILAVTEIILRVGAYLAVAVIIWAGIQYQISQGEPERTKNARTTIINAIVGLVIAIFATAIVNLVGRNFY